MVKSFEIDVIRLPLKFNLDTLSNYDMALQRLYFYSFEDNKYKLRILEERCAN
ncbi:MAG: hypothetical protein ACFFAS_20590 [Promethearchaeota archaeon]